MLPLSMRGSSMQKRFGILVITLLFIIGLGIFVLPQRDFSSQEKRELKTNSSIKLDETFNSTINDVLKDQFYNRDKLTNLYYNIKVKFNNVAYKGLNVLSRLKNGDNYIQADYKYLSEDVIDLGDGYLINNVLVYDEDKALMASQRGYNLNDAYNRHPDLKWYVYFPTKIEEILQIGDINYGLNYRQDFLRQLDENITYSTLNITSVEEHKVFFYKTDFHWNGDGAYVGYSDIINMIGKDFDIGKPKAIKERIVYDYKWKGSTSSAIGQVGDYDQIIDLELEDIGNFDYYVNGNLTEFGGAKEIYKEKGNISDYSDYDYYFGDNSYERVFDFHDDTEPNILIFNDSFCNVNQKWLASHFNKTVFIDLRANQGDFNLDAYIEKYNIDIVLMTQMYKNLFFNGNLFIPLD